MLDKPVKVLKDAFSRLSEHIDQTTDHLYITGRAGTGKSTLLQLYRKSTKKKVVVLAPTGIAALNVKGQTIHSFFGFPPKLLQPDDIKTSRFRKIIQKLDAVVIDEISMVRADVFDAIDLSLQINRKDGRPFGGVQMILFGDLFQLPPVVSSQMERHYFRTTYETQYFFSAKVFENGFNFETHELTKVYRQEERRFIQLLDSIRTASFDIEELEELNERYQPEEEEEEEVLSVMLSARNATVNQINKFQLEQLQEHVYHYPAKVTGNFQDRLFPTELTLMLKKGAQVMFIKNDPKFNYVNGTIGTISFLNDEEIIIQTDTGKEIKVERQEWEIIRYELGMDQQKIETKVLGTFSQYPLKLAWAMTIHKSQGKTFENIVVDLGKGAFEHGQTYVALSRCKTFRGIRLKNKITPRDILVDERIVDFHNTFVR